MPKIFKIVLLSMALVQGLYAQEKGVAVIGKVMWQDFNWNTVDVYTDWQGAIDYCRDLNYANYTDWTLPTYAQLLSLYENRARLKSFDQYPFWSSSTEKLKPGHAWRVNFSNKNHYIWPGKKMEKSNVRCVRAHVENVDRRYEQEKKVVLIGKTMWDDVSSKQRDWQGALDYCRDLNHAGYTDWTLPDVKQLESIADNRSRFKNNTARFYWSSDHFNHLDKDAWIVFFEKSSGPVKWGKKNMGYVRCVRINK